MPTQIKLTFKFQNNFSSDGKSSLVWAPLLSSHKRADLATASEENNKFLRARASCHPGLNWLVPAALTSLNWDFKSSILEIPSEISSLVLIIPTL